MASALAAGVALIVIILDRPTPGAWARNGPLDKVMMASILSFNVIEGGRPASEALDAIAAAAPDIVCLQELTPRLAEAFVRRLGARYPHRMFEPRPRTQGIGIASRHPLSTGQLLTLGRRYLPAIAADVELTDGPVHLACVHLIPPHAGMHHGGNPFRHFARNKAIRIAQTRALLDHLDQIRGPAIVLGDINEWPGQPALALLREAGFRDACHAAASRCGPTWPGRLLPLPALVRIDHILGRQVRFAGSAVLEAGGSDHYPVATRFTLHETGEAHASAR